MKPIKRLLFATLLGAAFHEAGAIGAFPRPIVMRQPDGTTLLVRLHGDENFHYATTADGFLIGRGADGYFRYVDYDFASGRKTLTAQRAHNASERTAAELATIGKLRNASIVNADLLTRTPIECKAPARLLDTRKLAAKARGAKSAAERESQYLVILVNFQDSTMRHTASDFDRWLNEHDYSVNGGTGSVKDYWRDNSMGQFVPNFKVVGPYTLSRPLAYYGENTSSSSASDANPRDMVREAVQMAKADNPSLDFAQFDNDGDGEIDNTYIIYAGYSEASTANDNDIWPHSWNMGTEDLTVDGVRVNNYSCSAELVGMPGYPATPSMDGIGTFAHEFGHVLGLKDQYDTDGTENGNALNPGAYSMYASGSYNNDSHTPPLLMAFERLQLGWMDTANDLTELRAAEDVTLGNLADNVARYIDCQPTRAEGTGVEWYILENRQQEGWDKYIPAHGLLITHYDYTDEMVEKYWSINGPNNNAKHRCMYIVPADNVDDEYSRKGDTYPGSSANTAFTDDSRPAALNWAGKAVGVPITNITEGEGQVRFQAAGGTSAWNVVKTLVPSDVRDTTATFRAEVSTSGEVKEVGFRWTLAPAEPTQESSVGGSQTAADAAAPALTVGDLQPGSNYNVRAYMVMADGSTVWGSTVPFSTECKTGAAPFETDFTSWTNGQLDCWEIVDGNGDGTTWVQDESSNSVVCSTDVWNDSDEWLIMKRRIHVPQNGTLFFTRGIADETLIEGLEVYVSTKTSAKDDFVLTERFSFADQFGQQVMEEVDLSQYAGQDIYVAFRCTSERMQGDLWLWDVLVAEKYATPTITRFERTGAETLTAEWTPSAGATVYYLCLSKETDETNEQAVFTPMDFYEDVQGKVSTGTGSLFFTGDGSVTLKAFPDGITDCKFMVLTSGPFGTSELTVEGTVDGTDWEPVGAKTSLSEYDSEGQEVDLSSYLDGKGYVRLRFNFKHGGRNARIKYLTLFYNDGHVYEDLASGAVYDTKMDIRSTTTGEWDKGRYRIWVASGIGNLFFDESLPAYYDAATASIEEAIDGTNATLRTDGHAITLSGLKTGQRITCTAADGTILYNNVSTSDRLTLRPAHHGVCLVGIDGVQTKVILK